MNKMRRLCMTFGFVLAIVLIVMPQIAWADTTITTDTGIITGSSSADSPAVYILTEDVTLYAPIEIQSGYVKIDLDGHTLTGCGTQSVITVSDGAYFTLTDSSKAKSGRIASGTADFDGGTADSGGGVYNSGTFTMTGGSIAGCTANSSGGGVYNSGTFTMAGGSIAGCTANSSGGGVYNSGTFTMAGGSIAGCTADSGGGVYNSGTFTIAGGSIAGCTANFGGGVYNSGTFTMTDGSITSCTAFISGGAVNLDNGGTFIMTGGTISGCTASADGGGVYNSGTFTMTDGSIAGCTAGSGGGVYLAGMSSDCSFTMNGADAMLSGCRATDFGGGIFAYHAMASIKNGTISGCTASGSRGGGGVFVIDASLAVEGGMITGCTAQNGGGVYLMDATLNMAGGEISGNTATNTGGGVYMLDSTAYFSGCATIDGNLCDTDINNVFAGTIYQLGNLTGRIGIHNVGCYNPNSVEIVGKLLPSDAQYVGTSCFFMDSDSSYVGHLRQEEGHTDEIVLAKFITKPTAKAGLIYDGTEKTGVKAEPGYTLSGEVTAVGAGTYKAHATLSNGCLWADGSTDGIDIYWTILQAEVMLHWAGTELTYNGMPQKPIVQMSGYVSGDDVDIIVTGAQSAVGTYRGEKAATAALKGRDAGNYKLPETSSTHNFSITKANNILMDEPVAAENLKTDGTANVVLLSTPASAKFGTVLYSIDGGTTWREDIPETNKAGTYTVMFKVEDHQNYSGISGSIPVEVRAEDENSEHFYPVSDIASANGTVAASVKTAESGQVITLTVTPEKGYTLETLTVTDSSGKEIELTISASGRTCTFKMPESGVTIAATFMEDNSLLNFFVDVPADAWFYDSVRWAVKNGITTGTDETHFTPYRICTRAQMITFLWRAAGRPQADNELPFTDVGDGEYYTEAVRWATSLKITNGISKTAFGPDGNITREQLATLIYNYAKTKGEGFTGTWLFRLNYDDAGEISYWADEAMHWCVMNGIVNGVSKSSLAPQKTANRAEVLTMLYRYFELSK